MVGLLVFACWPVCFDLENKPMTAASEGNSTQAAKSVSNSAVRINGLNSLRFFAAFCVVAAHLQVFHVFPATGPFAWLGEVIRSVCNGPVAVQVFFIISGFVIHFPHVERPLGKPLPFWAHRGLRLGLPMLIMTLLTYRFHFPGIYPPWTGFRMESLGDGKGFADFPGIMWSLVAEAFYYAWYPFVARLARRTGWLPLILVAYLIAFGLVAWQPQAQLMNNFTNWLAWLVGWPAWLLGCWLAEQCRGAEAIRKLPGMVWGWRLVMLGLCVLAGLLARLGTGWLTRITMPSFLQFTAVVAVGWIAAEIRHAQARGAVSLWEWLGRRSYSMYLVHMAGITVWAALVHDLSTAPPTGWRALARLLTTLLLALLFYAVVEAPSWNLARRVGRKLRERTPLPAGAEGRP